MSISASAPSRTVAAVAAALLPRIRLPYVDSFKTLLFSGLLYTDPCTKLGVTPSFFAAKFGITERDLKDA
jgi:hypothetical protein